MSTDSTKRQPAGIPVGGQFASHDRADSALTLAVSRGAYARADWDAQDGATGNAEVLRNQMAVRAFERTLADHLPVGTKAVFTRGWGDEDYELDRVERDGIALERDEQLAAVLAPMLGSAERIPDDAFDYEEGHSGEYRSLTVKAPAAPDRLDAIAGVRRASEEAGLGGVMPAVFDVLLDRADGDEAAYARYANITPEQVTQMYDLIVGPAIDDIPFELEDMDNR